MTHKSVNLKPLIFLSSFLHWHVKGFLSKRIALTIYVIGPDNMLYVIGPDNMLFADASVHLSAWTFYRLGQ